MSATDPTGDHLMPGPSRNAPVDDLAPLAGRWRIEARFPSDPPVTGAGEVSFEWIEERAFLVQRWRSDEPAAPDGIAVLGFDEAAGRLVPRYLYSPGRAPPSCRRGGGGPPPALLRLARRRPPVPHEPRRRRLAPVARSPRLRPALHRHLLRRWRDDLGRLGEEHRRRDVGARLRPHLHTRAGPPRARAGVVPCVGGRRPRRDRGPARSRTALLEPARPRPRSRRLLRA